MFEALPPRIDALCPIGAGDALAAAFVWSMEKKKSFAESLRKLVVDGRLGDDDIDESYRTLYGTLLRLACERASETEVDGSAVARGRHR